MSRNEKWLRRAARRALRLLDEALGDTDSPRDNDHLTLAYRTLDRALVATDPRRKSRRHGDRNGGFNG